MKPTRQVALVQAWQDAVNKRDTSRLIALSDPDIEIIGPRGAASGHAVLRDWLERAGLSVTTQRVFVRGDAVVVAQRATWRSDDTGDAPSEADIASCFRIAGDKVAQVGRHDTLDTALEAGGLGYEDEDTDA